jgi:phosphoenolpyruvate carboxykinase (ATP)
MCINGFEAIPEVDGTASNVFILINLTKKLVLIGGTSYAGEMKKSMFSVMNYLLPKRGIFPMHCSANIGKNGDTTLFFGLSGTGKTSLSADPNRMLIGDDEHGWSDGGTFNFEGGCYAKCINLNQESEPQIWNAIKSGAVLENVVIDKQTLRPNFDDGSLTENTRAAYPLEYIPTAVFPSVGGHPKVIVFLTADALGVLPPLSRLTKEGAMYHFMSGYTSKLAGTERGIKEPKATFSECFGAPFMPRPAASYAKLLGEKIRKHNTIVYLINTGWSGGPYGLGKRISIKHSRAMVTAALTGALDIVKYRHDELFNLDVPTECPDIPPEVLDPKTTWQDRDAYDLSAKKLAQMFVDNFKKFKDAPQDIVNAGPKP